MKKIISLFIIIINIQFVIYSQPGFTNMPNFGTGISRSSDWGDYDNDGDWDLAVGNIEQDFIYTNDGNGNFIETACIDSIPTNFVKWIDIEGDGDIDLFIGNNGTAPNYIWYNQGNGNLIKTEFLEPLNITDISNGDFDGDGDIDLIITSWNEDFTIILKNDGNNNYSPDLLNEFNGAISSAVFDADNDTDMDIILGIGCCIDSSEVYKNDGTGIFSLYSRFGDENAHMSKLSIADVDDDGDNDITSTTGDSDSKVCIYSNNGNGKFTSLLIDNINFSCAEFGDIDDDNDIDLVVGAYGCFSDRLAIYLNNNMSFTKSVIETGGFTDWPVNAISDISLGDADNDGDLDIAVMRFIWSSEFNSEEEQNTLFLNSTFQSINDKLNDSKYVFYPNPTVQYINIYPNDINIISIEVLNTYGQTLYTFKKNENKNIKQIDLFNYPNGIYLIKMIGRDFTIVEKIIKQ